MDAQGVPAVALNVAIDLKAGVRWADSSDESERQEVKWKQQEIKPRVQDKLHDDAILWDAARHFFHAELHGASDDVKDYFNLIPLQPSQYWLSCLVWDDAAFEETISGGLRGASFISEYRLGFGVSLSSNVGQRFADLIIGEFRFRFDEQEAPLFDAVLSPAGVCIGGGGMDELTRNDASGWTDACRWIGRRRTLGRATGRNELRAYSVKMYTDDAVFTVVGTERMVRALEVWRGVTHDFGLTMAIARKRQIGSRLTWLGFHFHMGYGALSVTPEKIRRAQVVIGDIVEGAKSVHFDAYRSLLGLLEHLLVVVHETSRRLMDGLYAGNYARGERYGPDTEMIFTKTHQARFKDWSRILLRSSGCYFSAGLTAPKVVVPPLPEGACTSVYPFAPTPRAPGVYYLFSDAASETNSGGIGGWVHGEWWCLAADGAMRELLHITALEFVGIGVNVILYGQRLAGCRVRICADALASVQILLREAARSPVMQAIYRLIRGLPEFALLCPLLDEVHVYGEGNVMADAASRAKYAVISALASQLGVVARQLDLPDRALHFVADVIREAQAVRVQEAAFWQAARAIDPAEDGGGGKGGARRAGDQVTATPPRPHRAVQLMHLQHRGKGRSSNDAGDGPDAGTKQTRTLGRWRATAAEAAAEELAWGSPSAAANYAGGGALPNGPPPRMLGRWCATAAETAAAEPARGSPSATASGAGGTPQPTGPPPRGLGLLAAADGAWRTHAAHGASASTALGGRRPGVSGVARARLARLAENATARRIDGRSSNSPWRRAPRGLGRWLDTTTASGEVDEHRSSIGGAATACNERVMAATSVQGEAAAAGAEVAPPRGALGRWRRAGTPTAQPGQNTDLNEAGARVCGRHPQHRPGRGRHGVRHGQPRDEPGAAPPAGATQQPTRSQASRPTARGRSFFDVGPGTRSQAVQGSIVRSRQAIENRTTPPTPVAAPVRSIAANGVGGGSQANRPPPLVLRRRPEAAAAVGAGRTQDSHGATEAGVAFGAQHATSGSELADVPSIENTATCSARTWQPEDDSPPFTGNGLGRWRPPGEPRAPPPRAQEPPPRRGGTRRAAPAGSDSPRARSRSRHPQPAPVTIAEVFYAPGTHRPSALAGRLLVDTGGGDRFALRPRNEDTVLRYAQAVEHGVEKSVITNTRVKNNTGWDYWCRYTSEEWGTSALRSEAPESAFNERFLVASFLVWLASPASGMKSSLPGRTFCKADSYMAHVYAVRRVHDLQHIPFACLDTAKLLLKTFNDEYVRLHGPESLIPARREPAPRSFLRMMLDPGRTDGMKWGARGARTLRWGSWFGINLSAQLCTASSGGFRKAELGLPAGVSFGLQHTSRASLFWITRDVFYRFPSETLPLSMGRGDRAGLLTCCCKNDRWGMHFVAHPLYFNFDPDDDTNTAARLRTLVLACPVEPGHMRTTPLFTSGPNLEPMRHHDMDMVLNALLRVFLTEVEAQRYSWHSWRVGLACALLAAGAPEGVILALCRWRSAASLLIYARYDTEAPTRWRDAAAAEVPTSIQTPNLPALPPQQGSTAALVPRIPGAASGHDGGDWASGRVPGDLPTEHYAWIEHVDSAHYTAAELRDLVPQAPEVDAHDLVLGFNRTTREAQAGVVAV